MTENRCPVSAREHSPIEKCSLCGAPHEVEQMMHLLVEHVENVRRQGRIGFKPRWLCDSCLTEIKKQLVRMYPAAGDDLVAEIGQLQRVFGGHGSTRVPS